MVPVLQVALLALVLLVVVLAVRYESLSHRGRAGSIGAIAVLLAPIKPLSTKAFIALILLVGIPMENLTLLRKLTTVQAMQFASKKRILTLTIGALFGLWSVMFGVVIAEQIEVMMASSEEKTQACELALAGLAQALKPEIDVTSAEHARDKIVPIASEAASPGIVIHDLLRSTSLHPLSSAPIFQRLCTYRI